MENDKMIMVVETDSLLKDNYFFGFKPHEEMDFEKKILKNFKYMKRKEAEVNPKFRQPVAYAVIFNPKLKKVFLYRRSLKTEEYKEKRLQGKWSIGIGGHIEKIDAKTDNPIKTSLLREIEEEIDLKGKFTTKVLGYINRDNDSVGKVHFGILYLIETDSVVKPKSKEIENGSFVSVKDIEEMIKSDDFEMEGWSQIAFEAITSLD